MAHGIVRIRTYGASRFRTVTQNLIVVAVIAATLAAVRGALAQDEPIKLQGPYTPQYAVGEGIDRNTVAALSALNVAAKPLAIWQGSFSLNSTQFPFTMVGTDPSQGSVTTKVNTIIVPLIIKVPGHFTFNPNKKVGCGGTRSAVFLVKNSPIFASLDYNLGGTDVGTTQYTDAFQRANFWTTVSGSAPDYHVLLSKPKMAAAVTVKVPLLFGGTLQAPGPCGPIGAVDINWFDLIEAPKLLKRVPGIRPNTLPIFVVYDVVLADFGTGACCIIGYHNAKPTTKGAQTFAETGFLDSSIFSGIDDVVPLGHEVAEWMDDPFANNGTPPWGNIGQVAGCQANLEVGDPLSGTEFAEMTNGFNYHVQDLAFVPWFAKAMSSFSVNGWFSFMGTFKSSAANCP